MRNSPLPSSDNIRSNIGNSTVNSDFKSQDNISSIIREEVIRVSWHYRIVSFCKNIKNKILPTSPSYQTKDLIEKLINKRKAQSPHKCLAAFSLHTGKKVTFEQYTLDSVKGRLYVSDEAIDLIERSVQSDGVALAFEFLEKGKKLPHGYLENVLLPEICADVRKSLEYQKGSLTPEQAIYQDEKVLQQKINQLMNNVGITKVSNFSMERMIALDNAIRKEIVKSVEELQLNNNDTVEDTQVGSHVYNDIRIKKDRSTSNFAPKISTEASQQHTITPPVLTPPESKDFFLRSRTITHIKKIAENKSAFSASQIKDLANSAKRLVLRNKRSQIIFGLVVLVGAAVSMIIPPFAGITFGVALGLSLSGNLTYMVVWKGIKKTYKNFMFLHTMRKINKYADFDYSKFGPEDDERRKKLIKRLTYLCKYKTFADIYDAAADLEKIKNKIDKIAKKPDLTLAESINLEKRKASYEQKNRLLKKNMLFFDMLQENVVVHHQIIQQRHHKEINDLWEEKFANMPQARKDELLKELSKDKSLVINGQEIKITGITWWDKIIQKDVEKKVVHAEPETKDFSLKDTKIKKVISKMLFMKGVFRTFFKGRTKSYILASVTKIIKNIRSRSGAIFSNLEAPQLTVQSVVMFFVFYMICLYSKRVNKKINTGRQQDILARKKRTTWSLTGKRERTEREEIATMRVMAKKGVEPMVKDLIATTEGLEKIGSQLQRARKRGAVFEESSSEKTPDPNKKKYSEMSDKEAAIAIIKYSAWQQLINQRVNSATKNFHDTIVDKVSEWNKKVKSS